MEDRPKIPIELTTVDKMLEWLSVTFLLLLWIVTIAGFSKLPDEIPSHFNAAGQADAYSNKSSIFILAIVATVIFFGMTILNRYPHIYNYPVTVTSNNAKRLYTGATRLIRTLKCIVVLVFCGIVAMTYKAVFTHADGVGPWFLPIILTAMFVPVIIFLFTSINYKNHSIENSRSK